MNPTISVLVPTWQRPASLERCLRAIAVQTRQADEVIVITRESDAAARETAKGIAYRDPTRTLVLTIPEGGVIAAMQAGLDAATGTIIALTDDDAEPADDWLARLLALIDADPSVAGAGGLDRQPLEQGAATTVGRVQWFGRVIGRHHLGAGPARDVDVLKGVNCAFRAPLLRAVGFDARLRGTGAQLHWELGVCLPLRRAGWRLVYDPAVVVLHHVEARASDDELHRGRFSANAFEDGVHNEAVAIGEYLPTPVRVVWTPWAAFVGTVAAPGLFNAIRLRVQGKRWAWAAWAAARRGRALARTTRRTHPAIRRLPSAPRGRP